MEIVSEEVTGLEHKHEDVTFIVKPKATAGDKLAVNLTDSKLAFIEALCERMTIGWSGVTENGKPTGYSYAKLRRLPDPGAGSSIMLGLSDFIIEKTDILTGIKDILKKASGARQNG